MLLCSGCRRLQSGRDSVSALHLKATLCPGVRWPPTHGQWLLLGQHHLGHKAREDSTPCEGFRLMMLRVCPQLCRPRGHETAFLKAVTAQGPALLKSPECTTALRMKKKVLSRALRAWLALWAGRQGPLAAPAHFSAACLTLGSFLCTRSPVPFHCPASCYLVTSASYFNTQINSRRPQTELPVVLFFLFHYCFCNIIRL